VTELAVGYRRARSLWQDGSALELTQGSLEARLGFGADIRITETFTLSPLATLGVGVFGKVEFVDANGAATNLITRLDNQDSHGWFTLQLGGHFDLLGKN
jgi:hypothetical protein